MAIADPESYRHAELAIEARLKRETEEARLRALQPAAESEFRQHLWSQFRVTGDTAVKQAVRKVVVLDADGLAIKENGAVHIIASWETGDTERVETIVMDKDSQPFGEAGRTYYGAWADRVQWLSGAVYDATLYDQAHPQNMPDAMDSELPRTGTEG